ncbi:MAG: LytTR family DNA-binding domain-containing protein [Bacteroidota bacterium]
MRYKALIIDDEIRARIALKNLCEKFIPDLEIVAHVESAAAGLEAIRTHTPDLLFLDIQMPHEDGISLVENNVLPNLEIIFVTAHKDYAIQALRIQAHDYLLKPIGVTDLEEAMERFRQRRNTPAEAPFTVSASPATSQNKMVTLPTNEGMILTQLSEITQCEGVGAYTIFHLTDGRQIAVTRNLKKIEQQFAEDGFFRVHHRHLVNLTHIGEVNAKSNFLMLKNGDLINISLRKKPGFLKLLKGFS